MNLILKAYEEGVEEFEKVFFVENGELTPETYVKAKSFLSSFTKNLLEATKQAGPGEKKTDGTTIYATPDDGFNECRTSFHSVINESIKEIK